MAKLNKHMDPAGEIMEDELIEVTSGEDATGGITPTVIATVEATVAASVALCPTTKCSKDC